ncbi:MAG TPA: protein-glutamate O-methyltransferase CheR [Gaiellaceae bacterium]|jgi:chemotaxis protein methyltransferase CheR|nr:protein-glutamate O-methyltransferase CheR [Gaiellaceae bacterium]
MSVAATQPRHAPRDEYVEFCESVRRLTGIDLLQYKRGQMERRIRTFAGTRGETDLRRYLMRISGDAAEREAFLDRVTINVSQLWRNPNEWEALARDVLPELLRNGRVNVWSAGSSYGAEAYTVAALCLEVSRNAKPQVHGTDIDPRMVAQAREGAFSVADARSAPAAALERWFDRTPGGYTAKPELRARVSFDTGDLLRMPFPRARYDLVCCRNTVIYFTDEVRDELHARLVTSIRPGGYFLIGSTERVSHPQEIGLEVVRPFLYRRVS